MSLDVLKAAVLSFAKGWVDSWRWVLVIHRINRVPEKAASGGEEEPRRQPLTNLALRRQKLREAAGDSSTSVSPKSDADQPSPKKKPSTQLLHCILANVVGLLSLWTLQQLLSHIPVGEDTGFRAKTLWILSLILHAVWLVPYFTVTRVVNVLWFQDIANASLRQLDTPPPPAKQSIGMGIADFVLAIVLETLFLVQSSIVRYFIPIPWIGLLVQTLHLSLLHALYAFEYRWSSAGESLQRRLHRMETNWPYFFGFGLTLCVLTSWSPSLILSGCLFGLGFPFVLIASFHADPPKPGDLSLIGLPVFQPSLALTSRLSVRLSAAAARVAQRSLHPQ